MHGPLQFEANAAIFFIFGDSDYTSRLLYAIAGTTLVALPMFFRSRLGRLGALFTSVMLAFSPALLYFSRFARNDILMAVWVLGLVICMWRYIDEGKHRYVYIAAALLALAFASKETSYLITALLGPLSHAVGTISECPTHLGKSRHPHRRNHDCRCHWPLNIGVLESGQELVVVAGTCCVSADPYDAVPANVVGGYRHIPGHGATKLV